MTLQFILLCLVWYILGFLGCDPNRYAFFSIAFFVGSIATSVVASSYLLSSDAWAAYLSPEGYLALQILQTALAHT